MADPEITHAFVIQRKFQHTVNAVFGQYTRKTHCYIVAAVLSAHDRADRNNAVLVAHDGADDAAGRKRYTGTRITFQIDDVRTDNFGIAEQFILVDRLCKTEFGSQFIKRYTYDVHGVPRYE